MPLSDLTDPTAINAAMGEFDQLGRDNFLGHSTTSLSSAVAARLHGERRGSSGRLGGRHEGECRRRGSNNAVACLAGAVAEWRLDYPNQRPTGDCLRRYLAAGDVRHAAACLGSDDGDLLVAVWLAAKT